jgi:polysaccharide export outer membrane protein
MPRTRTLLALAAIVAAVAGSGYAEAQPSQPQSVPPQAVTPQSAQTAPSAKPPAPPAGVAPPPGYVIGNDDVLMILFWREKDMSAEVSVRPDGKITLPLLNDVQAAGLTPDQLRDTLTKLAEPLVQVPTVTVVVKQINSRRVFITGQVAKPGAYPLNDRMTVLQLIALAGGLTEFAKSKDIVIMRNESDGTVRPSGEPITYPFNYKDVIGRRNLKQNIELKPGDTVIVPG